MLKKKPRCRAADLILADINNNYEIDSSIQSEQSNDCSSDVAGAIDNSSILSTTISFNSDVSSFGPPSLKDEETLDSDEDDLLVCKNTSFNHNLDYGSSSDSRSIDCSTDRSHCETTQEFTNSYFESSDVSSLDSNLINLNISNIQASKSDVSIPSDNSNNAPIKDINSVIENSSKDITNVDEIILLEEEDFIEMHNDSNNRNNKPKNTAHSTSLPNSIDTPITQISSKIGSFNIQNQFDHMAAGELFVKGNFALLSLQEPYAAHTRGNKSWEAFMKKELEEARINATFSKYQVLLIDDAKWGSKIVEDIKILQKSRIMSVVFKLSNNNFIGFISIYAITCSCSSSTSANKKVRQKLKTRKKTTNTIESILASWKSKFPNINPIILGDIQETISTEDRDNALLRSKIRIIFNLIYLFKWLCKS